MPAKATASVLDTSGRTGTTEPRKIGIPAILALKLCLSSPRIIAAWARLRPAAKFSRSGPAGTDRPLPMPKPPSKTKKDRSLYNPGFWKPSSMTITSAPDRRAFCAPATRSGLTMTGARRASSSGSSPTSDAVCFSLSTMMFFKVPP